MTSKRHLAPNVLLLGPYPPPHGGVEIHVVALHDHLREHGYGCSVVNLSRGPAHEDQADVYDPTTSFEVLRLLLRLRYDVVHFHVGGDFSRREIALGLLCAWQPGVRAVFTFHSGGFPTSEAGRRATSRSLLAFALRQFDAVIAVNREIARFFARLKVSPERIRLISPAAMSERRVADILAVDLEATISEELLRFHRAHRPLLLSIGGLETEYDIPTQIDALGLVLERHPRAGLMVIGDGGLRSRIEAYAARKSYRDHIRICGDVSHRQAMRLLVESDLFLRTTLYDGDAISVREALQFGTPVVATDNGMRPEGVDLVPVSDPVALAEAIGALAGAGRRPSVAADETGLVEVRELYAELLGRDKK